MGVCICGAVSVSLYVYVSMSLCLCTYMCLCVHVCVYVHVLSLCVCESVYVSLLYLCVGVRVSACRFTFICMFPCLTGKQTWCKKSLNAFVFLKSLSSFRMQTRSFCFILVRYLVTRQKVVVKGNDRTKRNGLY